MMTLTGLSPNPPNPKPAPYPSRRLQNSPHFSGSDSPPEQSSTPYDNYKTGRSGPIIIPQDDPAFLKTLGTLTNRLNSGEYIVTPASGRYTGVRKNFNIKCLTDKSEHFLRHGALRITPKNAESDVVEILLKRTRGPKSAKILTIELHTSNNPVLVYRHKGGIVPPDWINRPRDLYDIVANMYGLHDFVEAAARQLAKSLRNEQDYKPDLLGKLNL